MMKNNNNEIDEGTGYIGYREAFNMITSNVKPGKEEQLPLASSVGRIAAEDIIAAISYPTVDVTLKDGYAVIASDVAEASARRPVRLKVTGSVFAGVKYGGEVTSGTTVKVCSGAPIPLGANAVVSGEFGEEAADGTVLVRADAGEGRNILRAGGEVKAGATIVQKGERLLPGSLGMAAAAGIHRVKVYTRPGIAIVGVGDEVVAPGEYLNAGQLYASNLVTMQAWLASFGLSCAASVVKDDEAAIKQKLVGYLRKYDVILTSGGAWGSERDLVIGCLDRLGWKELFHHVRMGPGKGIAFGLWEGTPVFCLPGGPASNEMAFLQLALPGILRMAGDNSHPLRTVSATLTEDVTGRHTAWTEFKDAVLYRDDAGQNCVRLYKERSRLQAIARANGLICIPEGTDALKSGAIVPVQILASRPNDIS
ncbi:MAG: gephyrin-like molybdotransferase Glp [Dehalococcoidales bacterium]|jgi:molybdopterin molybdotransferase